MQRKQLEYDSIYRFLFYKFSDGKSNLFNSLLFMFIQKPIIYKYKIIFDLKWN